MKSAPVLTPGSARFGFRSGAPRMGKGLLRRRSSGLNVVDLSRLFEGLVELAKARAGRFDRLAFVPVDPSRLLNAIREIKKRT